MDRTGALIGGTGNQKLAKFLALAASKQKG